MDREPEALKDRGEGDDLLRGKAGSKEHQEGENPHKGPEDVYLFPFAQEQEHPHQPPGKKGKGFMEARTGSLPPFPPPDEEGGRMRQETEGEHLSPPREEPPEGK